MVDKKNNNSNFVYDKKRGAFVYDDGVISDNTNFFDNFHLYYGWVCEKVDRGDATYNQWKEALGFLSLEKYRAYVEKDDFRIKLLEMGMLIYINKAIDTDNKKICILGFRHAVRWGYISVLLLGKEKFSTEKRYLKFLYKIVKRYYIESTIKYYNIDSFYKMGIFYEFIFSILAIALNKKNELLHFGTESLKPDRTLFFKDSHVKWEWLMKELKQCNDKAEYKKILNILHIALNDYINFKLEKSTQDTFTDWKKILKQMQASDKEWVKDLVKEEDVLYKKMKMKFDEMIGNNK